MSAVPGSAGLPLVGDKSYDFYKDPIRFMQKQMTRTRSRVFLSRFLNKPTVFICSNKVLHRLLNEESEKLELGYKQFMGEIYGDNILFTDGDSAMMLRDMLGHLFTDEAIKSYQETIDSANAQTGETHHSTEFFFSYFVEIFGGTAYSVDPDQRSSVSAPYKKGIVNKSFTDLNTRKPVCVYTFFKRLAIEICLSLFLGLDFNQSDASIITELTTTHWHGIISVPVAVKIPMMSESTYSKALQAKQQLLKIITQRRAEKKYSFPRKVESLPDVKDVFINNHLLLLTSALVPKALSSILTSFAIEIGDQKQADLQEKLLTDESMLEAVLLEVLRLYPPFIGGRRVISQEFMVEGYRMPKDHAILFMTYGAQRDPEVFDDPDEFKPERWLNSNKNDKDKLYCFGAGPRCCLGQTLVWAIIKTVIYKMLSTYKFKLSDGQDLTHKWLPVSRPVGNLLVDFQPRLPQ